MGIEDCTCEKKCAKYRIAQCPGHIAAKESKKRLNKEAYKNKKKEQAQASRFPGGQTNEKLMTYGIKYAVCVDPEYPRTMYRERFREKWESVDNRTYKLVRNYTKFAGELLPCHKEMLEKGTQAIKMLFGAKPEIKEPLRNYIPTGVKACPTVHNLHLFTCPLCRKYDASPQHMWACSAAAGTHLSVPTLGHPDFPEYVKTSQEFFDTFFALPRGECYHYFETPESLTCQCATPAPLPAPLPAPRLLPPVPLFGDKENIAPLLEGGVKKETLEKIAALHNVVQQRKEATLLLIEEDKQRAKKEQVLVFAAYLISRLDVGKSVSLKQLWEEKKSSNKNRGDFTSDSHFFEMVRTIAGFVPKSLKVTYGTGGHFIKLVTPISLEAIKKCL